MKAKIHRPKANAVSCRFKPYPTYKFSDVEWLRDMPKHWELLKLGWIAQCLDGRRIPLNSEERSRMKGEYPYWGANSIVDYIDSWLFDEELVLLGEDGAPFLDRTKQVAFHVHGKIWVNNHAHVLRPRPRIGAVFFTHVLNCVDYRVFIDGATRDKLTQGEMNGIPIQCPPIEEQQIIASFLDHETATIDALVAKKERLIELLHEKRTALITRAITKGLDPNVPMKDSGGEWLGEVPEGWSGTALKRWVEVKITDGPHETPEFIDEGIPFVSAEGVRNGRIDFDLKRGYISPKLHTQFIKKLNPKRHDIFFVKSGATTGKLAMVDVDFEFSVWSPLALIRANLNKVIPQFLFSALHADYVQNQIQRTWSAGTQPNISMEAIEQLFIVAPPVSEQHFITALLDRETAKIDELVAKIREAIEKLKEYRTALISAAVTGKIDVREQNTN